MRWRVAVTSIGKTDTDVSTVDAATWQEALNIARAQRGETASMSSFSIEVLGDGYRAIDGVGRLVFRIEPADGAPAGPAPTLLGPPPNLEVRARRRDSLADVDVSEDAPTFVRPPKGPSDAPERPETPVSKAPSSQRLRAAPPMPPRAQGTSATDGSMLPTQVVFKREQDPTPEAPLTYREYVYAVAQGSSEDDAERLLRAQFELIRRSMEQARPGKLVNLAVFDVVFKGKPPVLPLATLVWKDWRGAPIVDFPRRRTSMRPGTGVSNVPAAPTTLSTYPLGPPSVAAPEPAPTASAVPAFPPAPVPGVTRGSRPGPLRGRARGDDLVTLLFEAMHDLHFLRDALEGGEFCLALALESLPSLGGVVHFYDIDHREFVIACAHGKAKDALLLQRYPESDRLLARAMRKRQAIVIPNTVGEEDVNVDRFRRVGGVMSLIVAPVMQAGRFLGAIEMYNPTDDVPYNDDEGGAIQYIAEQYADFVAQRGLVLDPERIRRSATRNVNP